MEKVLTTIDLCGKKIVYKGRLLGLINDKEFHALIKTKIFRRKVYSGQSIPLIDISKHNTCLTEMRVVLAVNKMNGKDICGRHLFISERLDYVTHESNGEIGILGEKDEFYTLTEGGV